PPPEEYPDPVQGAIRTIRNVIGNVQWFRMGDPRANVVEPQLGYILRNLEMDLQKGLGAAHGLLAVYELQKD
ncbi:MAG: class I SAM-dependent methyltransferase, partial [Gemmatimonadales bacterium]|nr:class I SAM-dependent methyltransferase [Gemmatimonadales bacterium]